MAEKSMIRDMTKGNVASELFLFAAPLVVANALQAIYNIVDMIVVGQVLGGTGMSAVSIGSDVLHLLTFLAIGFSNAGQVIIAQTVGAGERKKIQKLIGTMFSFFGGLSVTVAVLCFLLRCVILNWLNTPAESYAYTMDYMVTCITGLVFIYGYNIVSAILRGMGDAKRPFIFISAAAVINIVLDLFFVAVLHMEVFGAALATVIGQGASFIASLVYLYRHRKSFGFDFKPASFRIDSESLYRLLKLGVPMAIQSAAINISKILLTRWINDAGGVLHSALSGIYNKIGTMLNVIVNAFMAAGATMVGQNLGAGEYGRVRKAIFVVAASTMTFATVIAATMLLFPEQVCSLFTGDAKVLAESGLLTIPIVLNAYGAAVRAPSFAFINGSGNSKINLLVALLDGMVARIGLAALLGFGLGFGTQGFWYGDALAGFMPFVIGSIYYKIYMRKVRK